MSNEQATSLEIADVADTGVLDGEVIYQDANGVTVLAISSVEMDGQIHEVDPGHSYTVEHGNVDPTDLFFQQGAVKENGVNGLTNEALLAVVIHRTKILDAKFPSDENKVAIANVEAALEAFESRTKNRQERGVEGLAVA